MKVAVIGTTGFVGSNITNELANRNHSVTGISRNAKESENSNVTYVPQDVTNVNELAETLKGSDVVVSAYNAHGENAYEDFLKGYEAIQEAVKASGVQRYIVIGGAGSLYVAEGVQAIDHLPEDFPKEWIPGATAAKDYLNILKDENDLDWTFFSPPFEMHPGVDTGRTGKYRLGTDFPVFNEEKRSILSVQDLAVVIADEVENHKHSKVRFTAAY